MPGWLLVISFSFHRVCLLLFVSFRNKTPFRSQQLNFFFFFQNDFSHCEFFPIVCHCYIVLSVDSMVDEVFLLFTSQIPNGIFLRCCLDWTRTKLTTFGISVSSSVHVVVIVAGIVSVHIIIL